MAQGNISGLTPKQEDMSFARSPLASQQQNEVKPKEEKGTTAGERAQTEQEGRQEQQTQTSQQARQQQQASPVSMAVENVASKLSNFSYTLRGYVNQFLQGGASAVGLGQAKEQYKYDPDSKKYVLSISEQQADIEPVLQEKMRQQEKLKQSLSPFAQQVGEKLVGKQFGQVLEEQFGEDPQISSLLQTVTALQDLEARGLSGSPEAKALEAQIREQDQFGMVSSLREAMQSYNKLMGVDPAGEETKWYGDQADTGYSALDIAQLSSDTLRTEIEKAREFSSGLFGGDFEENLKKKYDTESAEGQAAARRKEAVHSELMSGFQSYMDEAAGGFQSARDTIDTAFKGAAEAVKAELALDDSAGGVAAMKWFESFQEGGDFTSILYNAMNDPNSGLGVEQRQAIADYIGKAGSGSKEGQLYTWINSLGTTGKIPINIQGEDGFEKTQFVEPSVEDKLQINALMKDKTLSPEEKTEKMHELIRGIGVDTATSIGSTIDTAMETANRTGSLAAGVVALNRGIVESLKTFAQSKTEDFVRQSLQIDDKTWNALDADAKSSLISRTLTNMTPEQKEQLVSIFHEKQNQEITKKDTYINQWRSSLKGRLAEIDGDPEKGIPGVLANVQQQIDDLGAQKNGIYTKFASKVQDVLRRDVSRFNAIFQQVGNNPWIQANVPGPERAKLAELIEWQEKLSRLNSMDPLLVSRLTGGAYSQIDPVDLAVSGAKSKDFTAMNRLYDAYTKSVNAPGTLDKMPSVITDHINNLYSQYKSDPNGIPPGMLTVMNVLGEYENTDGVLRQNLQQVQEARDKITNPETGYLAQVDELSKSADFPSFTPDQILGFSMGVAKGVETGVDWITGDKQPPSIKDIDWGKLGGEIEDIITNWAGYGPDAIKDALADKLGFPADSISLKGGVPHIQMSNGEYIPFSDALITKLSSATTENLTPMVAALPGEYAGPDIAARGDMLTGAMAKVPAMPVPEEKKPGEKGTVVGAPTFITQPQGKDPSFITQPQGKDPSFITQPQGKDPSFITQPQGVGPSFITQPQYGTVGATPTAQPTSKALPKNVQTSIGKVYGALGIGQGMLAASTFYQQNGRWPTEAELKTLKNPPKKGTRAAPPVEVDAQPKKESKKKTPKKKTSTPTQKPSNVTQPSGVSSGPQGSGGGAGYRR